MCGSENHDSFASDQERSRLDHAISPQNADQGSASNDEQAVDARLTQLLNKLQAPLTEAPAGLSGRVFAASVAMLRTTRQDASVASELETAASSGAELDQWADAEIESRLDELFTAEAEEMPAGLSGRVFEASVHSLPQRDTTTAPLTAPKLAGATHAGHAAGGERRDASSSGAWHERVKAFRTGRVFGGRLAMAASLALVAILGIWMVQLPRQLHDLGGDQNGSVAMNDAGNGNGTRSAPQSGVLDHDATQRDHLYNTRRVAYDRLVSEEEWQLFQQVDVGQSTVGYLVETAGLSLDELSRELDVLTRGLAAESGQGDL